MSAERARATGADRDPLGAERLPPAGRASTPVLPLTLRIAAAIAALLLLPFAVGDYWAYQLGLLYLYAIAVPRRGELIAPGPTTAVPAGE